MTLLGSLNCQGREILCKYHDQCSLNVDVDAWTLSTSDDDASATSKMVAVGVGQPTSNTRASGGKP